MSPPKQLEEGGAGFDQRLERLEQIVGELEDGGLALEAALERYQEGVRLLRDCRQRLGAFQKRVEELSAEGALEPAEDPDASEGAGSR